VVAVRGTIREIAMKVPAARRLRDQRGASAAEYAVLVSLIAIVIIVSVTFFGQRTASLFQRTCESVASTQGGAC